MEDKIRNAYDQMNPTDEQLERMLATLQDAQQAERDRRDQDTPQAERDQQGQSAPQASRDSQTQSARNNPNTPASFEAQPAPAAKRNGFRAWKIALPVAACLVIAAVGIGVGMLGSGASAPSPTPQEAAKTTNTSASSQEGGVAEEAAPRADSAANKYTLDAGALPESIGVPSDGFNTEEYAAKDENGFVSTKAQPLSTVSADVDTASYANLRRLIHEGRSLDGVPAGAVRTEEMLNYFTYNYETPGTGNLFALQAQAAPCPWNPDTQLLTIGFSTAEETSAAENGANLVFLIDVSGSMNAPDKLELLQDSFATLLEGLDANDRVSIVTYSGAEEVVLEGAPGDDEGPILRAIYKLRANGSTNGEAGIKMAYEVAERNFIPGGVNRIVMASDGDLNVGMTSESELYDLVESKRETGVYLSVLGFGTGNYKDTKMEVLADHGNGSYHYIDSAEEAKRVLSERLTANLAPFADDVKVQVEFNPNQVKGYRLVGYENRALNAEDFRNDAVDAGDVGPNSQFTVAYEVVLADSPYEISLPDLKYGAQASGDNASSSGAASSEWLTCSLRYRAFSDNEVHEQQLTVSAKDATTQPSDDWKFACSVIEFGMLASDSAYRGNLTCDSVLELLDAQQLNDERRSFRDLVEQAKQQTAATDSDYTRRQK